MGPAKTLTEDTAVGDGLGEDGNAGLVRLERDEDVRGRHVVLGRELGHNFVGEERGVVRAEGRVCRHDDSLCSAELQYILRRA